MSSRRRPMHVTSNPVLRLFPRAYLFAVLVRLLGQLVRVLARLVGRVVWPYRRELALTGVVAYLWHETAGLVGGGWGLLATAVIVAPVMVVPVTRRAVAGFLGGARVRRRLRAGLIGSRSTTPTGHPGWITRIRPTRVGYRAVLRLRPGQSAEQVERRAEELRAAVHCRDVRLTRNPNRSQLVTVDVITANPLATITVEWADAGRDVLSVWDPVHLGQSELGHPVRLTLAERAVFIGGNRGAGKSSGENVFVAHAAQSPDCELLLIDPNRVQLAPWADRALMLADHTVDDAIDVVRCWRDEIDRRMSILATLPGVHLGLTRALSAQLGWPWWLLVVDELAYHTSVAGTPAQQREFVTVMRDGVARGRAAGVGAVVATQRPTYDVVPPSLRDLFDIRIAYRTMTSASSDVILGDGFASRGFNAADIDITARGVGWVWAESPTPLLTKTTWIPPEVRADLAVTTVRHKPSLRRPHPDSPTGGDQP